MIEQTDTQVILADSTVYNVIQISCNGNNLEYRYSATAFSGTANINNMTLFWQDFCKDMGNKVSISNSCIAKIKTYDSATNLYSYDEYEKSFSWEIPRLVGIVADRASTQALANTYVRPALNNITIPAGVVNPQLVFTFEDCALIFEGTQVSSGGYMGQDGNRYSLSTTAYRIDGYTSSGTAIIHQVNISDEFIIRSNFNVAVNNYSDYFRYRGGTFVNYVPF